MGKNDTLYMKRPASWPYELGRDAIPLGNGKTGVLVPGSVGDEEIIFNRYDLWHWQMRGELPNVSDALPKMRELIDAGKYTEANDCMFDRLRERGYASKTGSPLTLGSLKLHFKTEASFSRYRRVLRMDSGECEVSYRQGTRRAERRCFVSREDDTFYYEYTSNEESEAVLSFDIFDDGTPDLDKVRENVRLGMTRSCSDNEIAFLVRADGQEYGARLRIFGAKTAASGNTIKVAGKSFRIAVKCCSGEGSLSALDAPADFDYGEKAAEHARLHGALYRRSDISFSEGGERFNEDLLDEAYDEAASPELIEKMWRFGRYLFISGTCEGGLPFPLYGLWHTKYNAAWSQHVANENVQAIYWHVNAGGLAELVLPLIDYYTSALDIFRSNAERLFGCKGIFIGAYTTPVNKHLSVNVPVILNFTGVAGWLCRHFYQYYLMSGDRETLDAKILPFMIEAADFYLDYIRYDESGGIVYYPCVSPENSPKNLVDPNRNYERHPNPVTKNATVEIAIVKELLSNLTSLINETGKYTEYLGRLEKALADMPEYMINGDGALKEWLTDELEDAYNHRHVSHIYPLFPGEEISKENDPRIYAAIERAVDLRELGSQTGWSLAHMASIYATLERADDTLECLDTLLKGCTLNNFMTMHNDWRNMGISLDWRTPIQLDANMGFVNAVQKMLFDERNGFLRLLPALPKRLGKGRAEGLCFTRGRVSLEWNTEEGTLLASVCFSRDGDIKLGLPEGFAVAEAELLTGGGACYVLGDTVNLQGKSDSVFRIACKRDK